MGIKDPGENKETLCNEYQEVIDRSPKEFRHGIHVRDGEILISFSDVNIFNKLFTNPGDGLAVDVITKEQYDCGVERDETNSWIEKGKLLRPLYKNDFETREYQGVTTGVIVKYGPLPKEFDPEKVEFNMVTIKKKWFCDYSSTLSVDFGNLSLLETGLYRDSVNRENLTSPQFKELEKTIKFEVPFERGKTTFKPEDIQPIYDTLNLTKYFIKKIDVFAYSSVEGSRRRNLHLQKERGKNLVNALKAYQKESLVSAVESEENWGAFYKDIEGTKYADLRDLSWSKLKQKLSEDRALLNELEPILSQHRRAKVTVNLEKRVGLETNDTAILQRFFDQSISAKNIDEALYIQGAIFDKIKNEYVPESFLGRMSVPQTLEYGPLLNNEEVFKAEQGLVETQYSIANFENLLTMLPGNQKLIFNITALKLKAWTGVKDRMYGKAIMTNINQLEKDGLNEALILRLRTNFKIVLTSYLSQEGQYDQKNQLLRELYELFQLEDMTDQDMVNLAKYLANYSQIDWAIQMMEDRASEEDVDVELLEYYLTITMLYQAFLRSPTYLELLDGFIEIYPNRFCAFFNPESQGGISFQLLEREPLLSRYCAVCKEQN